MSHIHKVQKWRHRPVQNSSPYVESLTAVNSDKRKQNRKIIGASGPSSARGK